jgi:hypothetical protein
MKLLYFLLSVYLVALSCLPCADMEVNCAADSAKNLGANHEKQSHEEGSDLCSPFCVCNCCGAQFVTFQTTPSIDFPTVTTVIATKESIYKSTFTSNFYGSIWQPPKIS